MSWQAYIISNWQIESLGDGYYDKEDGYEYLKKHFLKHEYADTISFELLAENINGVEEILRVKTFCRKMSGLPLDKYIVCRLHSGANDGFAMGRIIFSLSQLFEDENNTEISDMKQKEMYE